MKNSCYKQLIFYARFIVIMNCPKRLPLCIQYMYLWSLYIGSIFMYIRIFIKKPMPYICYKKRFELVSMVWYEWRAGIISIYLVFCIVMLKFVIIYIYVYIHRYHHHCYCYCLYKDYVICVPLSNSTCILLKTYGFKV